MIHDDLSQEAKLAILKAVKKSFGLQYHFDNAKVVQELEQHGYGFPSLNGKWFLSSKATSEIIEILEAVFFS